MAVVKIDEAKAVGWFFIHGLRPVYLNDSTWRNISGFRDLRCGDIIRQKSEFGETLVVTSVYGQRAIAVKTLGITSLEDWEVWKEGS
jgi:hypothetical protein